MPTTSIKVAIGNGRVIPSTNGQYIVTDSTQNEGIRFIDLPSYFSAYDNVGGIDVSAGWTDITWDTERRKDGIYTHTADSAVITINKTTDFIFSFDFGCDMTSSSGSVPSISAARLVVDTGGGYTEVAGTRCYTFHDRTTAGEASSSVNNIIISVTSGDDFKLQVQRFSGNDTIVTLADTCRIFIKSIEE